MTTTEPPVVPAGDPYPVIPTDGPSPVVRAIYHQWDGSTIEAKIGPLLQARAVPIVHLPTDPPPPPTCVYLGHRVAWFGSDEAAYPVCVRCGANL